MRGLHRTIYWHNRASEAHSAWRTLDAGPRPGGIHHRPPISSLAHCYLLGTRRRSRGSTANSVFDLLPWTVGVVDKARTLELDKRVV